MAVVEAQFFGEDEHVLNMEDFGDMLEAVDCALPELALDFVDQASFDAAISKWTWVNEKDVHHFVMFVSHPGCGAGFERVPLP